MNQYQRNALEAVALKVEEAYVVALRDLCQARKNYNPTGLLENGVLFSGFYSQQNLHDAESACISYLTYWSQLTGQSIRELAKEGLSRLDQDERNGIEPFLIQNMVVPSFEVITAGKFRCLRAKQSTENQNSRVGA